MLLLPTDPHDGALWLYDSLDNVEHISGGLWQGTLPPQWDFNAVVSEVDALGGLAGVHDTTTRRIEFHPASVGVYQTVSHFLSVNQRRAPAKFTIREISYTHGGSAAAPELVSNYLGAIKLWDLLTRLSDHTGTNGWPLHFIKSHEAKLELTLQYGQTDLVQLPSLSQFESDYVLTQHHREQKRNIVRSSLLELFKGKRAAPFSEVLSRFEELVESIRSSYAMYVAEFSFEKVRAEVEKDNLDSTLKLNRTFSEIQNQLLALPVALVLVGGQMTQSTGISLKNFVIWLGSVIFGALMLMLIHNQRNAVGAIGAEIGLRWNKIESQPIDVSGRFKPSFDDLRSRQSHQDRLLRYLRWVVFGSIAFSTAVLVWYSYESTVLELAVRLRTKIDVAFSWLRTQISRP